MDNVVQSMNAVYLGKAGSEDDVGFENLDLCIPSNPKYLLIHAVSKVLSFYTKASLCAETGTRLLTDMKHSRNARHDSASTG